MLEQQVKINKTQLQLSSGLNYLQPSDDPVATTRILAFKDEINQIKQYQQNIDTAIERNILQDSSLKSAENILFRTKVLTIQAANDTLTTNDRLSIKHEVDQLLDNLLGISNTQNANGEYLFSGYLSNTKPFNFDAQLGAYEYLGGEEQRFIQISPEQRIADGTPGFDIFQNIQSSSQEASVANETRSIFNTLSTLSDTLTNNFTDPQAVIQGSNFINTPVTLNDIISLTSDTGPTVQVTLNGTYQTIDELTNAINDPANSSPTNLNAAGIEARSNGNYIEFVSLTSGAASTISFTNIAGTFDSFAGIPATITRTSVDLTATPGNDLFHTVTDEVLTDLDNALEALIQARTAIGARLNSLDNQETQHEKFILDLQTTLSGIKDLDYAEAISRFNIQNMALQAAQQSFTRVQNLSLFNFL